MNDKSIFDFRAVIENAAPRISAFCVFFGSLGVILFASPNFPEGFNILTARVLAISVFFIGLILYCFRKKR